MEEPSRCYRTSCHAAEANQFRLFLHAAAYWLLWSMRRVMPKHSVWRVMQFDNLRLRLIKLAARVVELKTLKIHLPSSAPDQAVFAMLLDRLPRLVT
jgi:Transposase DDE domain group 1